MPVAVAIHVFITPEKTRYSNGRFLLEEVSLWPGIAGLQFLLSFS